MGTLYLVRHGQASLGADNYDQLSPRGQRQSQQLGRYWAQQGLQFDAVFTGTLQRHAQTWSGIAQGAAWSLTPQALPQWNEYDSEALIHCVHPAPLPPPTTPEAYRQHFRLLRSALVQWMEGRITPQGMPSYADFAQGVRSALNQAQARAQASAPTSGKSGNPNEKATGNVLIVSSGGPIASALGHILGAHVQATVELNLRIRNASITELHASPQHLSLLSYNTLPHFAGLEPGEWVTHA